MRFAYADPPYVGRCRYYSHEHGAGGCWDDPATTLELAARLEAEYTDGWALSCSVPSLRLLLPALPDTVRIGAWVKPWCSWKANTHPAFAWEPVLWHGGRNQSMLAQPMGEGLASRDWVAVSAGQGAGLKGAKPAPFIRWVFMLLGAQHGDELVDLFEGSGAVQREWQQWCAQPQLVAFEQPSLLELEGEG